MLGTRRSAAFGPSALARALDTEVERAAARPPPDPPLRELEIAAVYSRALAQLGMDGVGARTRAQVLRLHQHAWFAGVAVRPGVPALLRALRGRGLRVGLCSNAPYPAPILRAQLRHLELLPLLDAVVFSSEVGWRKPHPLIFRALVRRLRVPAAAVLFVGDSPAADLAGAAAAGMRARRAPSGESPDWAGVLAAAEQVRSWD